MRKHATYAAVLATLLFVGGGCATTGSVKTDADIKTGADSDARMMEGYADAAKEAVNANGSVDMDVDLEVDGILKDADAEKADQSDVEKDADDAMSDSAEFNAMMQGDYEIK